MRIFSFHLLNDYSGSPKVLMQLLTGWSRHDLDVTMVTSSGRDGFLSNIPGVKYITFWYRFRNNPLLRLMSLTLSQLLLVIKMWHIITKNDIIYINTVLPFGAAILGKLKGCRVIYHVHETTMKPPILKSFLFGIAKWTSNEVVYVSKYLANQEHFRSKTTHILYNALEGEFLQTAKKHKRQKFHDRMALMVCSLKEYKGVNEFVALSKLRPKFNFTLVVNASEKECNSFFAAKTFPSNLKVYPTQTDLHPFYSSASVVLNLSHVDAWVETFGLTIIEGMAYGLPAIVPPVGGITELVDAGKNGFLVDSKKLNIVADKLDNILSDEKSYQEMRKHTLKRVELYKEDEFVKGSISILNQ